MKVEVFAIKTYQSEMKCSVFFWGCTLLKNGMFSGAVKPDPGGVCVSKGGRFPPYESAGKPPNSW